MASRPSHAPPSYDDEPAAASAQIPVEPPTYDDVADSQPRDMLMTDELPCLIMNDCLIHAESQPENPLYEFSNSPTIGRAAVYAIEKIIYRLSTNDGEGALRQRKRHLYDFRSDLAVETFGAVVSMEAKASSKFAFKDVKMQSTAGTAWSTCKAEPHFKVGQSVMHKISRKKKDEFEWKDWDGKLVAVETKTGRKSDNTVERPPRLEIKTAMGEKELDLLAALWGARVWKETLKETAEPFTWAKCEFERSPNEVSIRVMLTGSVKRVSQMKQGPASGRLSYGFAHR